MSSLKDCELLKISCIIENKLYLSGVFPIYYSDGKPGNLDDSLKKFSITHILSLTSLDECHKNEQRYITKHLKLDDDFKSDIIKYSEDLINFIVEGTKGSNRILVHCMEGVSRSPTVICLYLMKVKNMTMEEALSYIQSKRSIIKPNNAFLDQLKIYENFLKTSK